MLATCKLINHEQHIANIHSNTTLQLVLESDIARHSLPVTVECQTNQTTLAVQYGRARVTTCDIEVTEETDVQLTIFVGILAVVLL